MERSRQQLLALLASLGVMAAILAAGGWRPGWGPAPDPELRALYGDAGLALLTAPPRWDAWLLYGGPVGEAGTFQGVAAQGGVLSVRPEGFGELLALLRDPRTFGEAAEPCGKPPLVGFRFSDGEAGLDLLLCFECNLLESCLPTGRQRRRFSRGALLPHVKRLWAEDPRVQGLR